MKTVFADTYFYLAVTNPRDADHELAVSLSKKIKGRVLTTAWVLTEVGDALSSPTDRSVFAELMESLRSDPRLTILPPDENLFDAGLTLHADRPDKEWSLMDCISFMAMEVQGVTEALTADHHFEQAGFTVLMK